MLLASHTGGADVLLGAQSMRAATQYLGAFLGAGNAWQYASCTQLKHMWDSSGSGCARGGMQCC